NSVRALISLFIATCFFMWTPYTSDGPAAQSQPVPVTSNEGPPTTDDSSNLTQRQDQLVRDKTTTKQDLQGAENALAQAMVALAQAQVPVAMLKREAPDDENAQNVLDAVEQHVDTAMNAYQNAVLASTGEAVHALTTTVHVAAIAAQIWVNIAVARLQLKLLHKHPRRVPSAPNLIGTVQQDRAIVLATQAMTRAMTHAEATQEQSRAAVIAARQVESAFSDEEMREGLASLNTLKTETQVRAMATGAQVMLVSAHATRDAAAIATAHKAVSAAEDLLMTTAAQMQKADIPLVPSRNGLKAVRQDAQMAVVRVRVAMSAIQVALAQAYGAGLEPPTSAKAAAAVVADQVQAVLQASRAIAQAGTEDNARIRLEAAQAGALAAAVMARVADVYIRLEMIQEPQDMALVTAARLAASEQLRTAIANAQNAITSADLASKAARQALVEPDGTVTPDAMAAVRRAKEQTEAQAYLGIAWAQSALYWTQAAWSWAQNMEEVAVASEAGAVAAESAATMIEATVGVSVGDVSQAVLGLNSVATFAITASPLPASESAAGLRVDGITSSPPPASPSDDAQVLIDVPTPPVGVASPSR
ncbi:MAG: hypothetical protein OEU26_05820, partial [Candidatus Tectomicrobia bacterium]|nr:hypothetical protein [Candidatus Tectomicrobia bacterium]